MKKNRDFYKEIKEKTFKPLTYKIYNKLDDELYISMLSKKDNIKYDIDDLEMYDLELDKKEKFLLSMHNKEFLLQIKQLKDKIEKINGTIEIDYQNGTVTVIKLKNNEL